MGVSGLRACLDRAVPSRLPFQLRTILHPQSPLPDKHNTNSPPRFDRSPHVQVLAIAPTVGQVLLERDSSQDDRDKYGRLLRYVWLPDGVLVNAALVQGGFAYEYTYRVQYAYEPQFMQLEHEAHGAGRGLWSPATCDTKAGRRYSAAYRTN